LAQAADVAKMSASGRGFSLEMANIQLIEAAEALFKIEQFHFGFLAYSAL
jgi:hypothetical protein